MTPEGSADDGKRLSDAYRARNVVFSLVPQGTYNYSQLREQHGGAALHPSGGWRIYIGGGFGKPRRLQKSEKAIGFIRFSAIFRVLC